MRRAAHQLKFHTLRLAETVKAPVWQAVWGHLQRRYGPDKFPTYEEFLSSSTDVYKYLQNELLAAENTRHLQDLCTEDLWPIIRATGADYEKARRHYGAEECRIVWTSTEAFVCSLGPPEDQAPTDAEPGATVVAGARFFAVSHMAFAPERIRHSIDDVIFKSAWDPEKGVVQWKIAHIGGPIAPAE